MTTTKTMWLLFADSERGGFLGVSIVDITQADIEALEPELAINFPNAKPGAAVILAATRKAHELGCNPGGQVMSCEFSPQMHMDMAHAPHGRLMQKAELKQLGLIE